MRSFARKIAQTQGLPNLLELLPYSVALFPFLHQTFNRSLMILQLRALHPDDAPILAQHANNINIARRLTEVFPHPYALEDAQAFIQKVQEHTPRRISAILLDRAFVGCIGLHPQGDIWRHNAELGYWLAEPYWGKGIMTHAVRQKVTYGFEAFPHIERIFARPFGSNQGSARVLEKAGFEFEARLSRVTKARGGSYEDELIYSVWREQWAAQ